MFAFSFFFFALRTAVLVPRTSSWLCTAMDAMQREYVVYLLTGVTSVFLSRLSRLAACCLEIAGDMTLPLSNNARVHALSTAVRVFMGEITVVKRNIPHISMWQ